jgi:uncharacterized protein (TIGR01244 family)
MDKETRYATFAAAEIAEPAPLREDASPGAAPRLLPRRAAQHTMLPTQPMPVLRTPRPGLCASGQPGSSAWGPLAKAGVRTVVNLRPDEELADRDEGHEVREAGIAYVHIPVSGPEALTRGAAYALQQVLLSSPATVLVHCSSANRAGALIALADAWFGSRDVENAMALGRDAGMTALEPTVRVLLGVHG